MGDHAVVRIECRFNLLTPLAGAIVGQPITIAAEAEFMIRGGEINGVPIGPVIPPTGCIDQVVPNLIGMSVSAARTAWTTAGFTGAFSPLAGSDTDTVTGQATSPASTPGDCLVATATVSVTHATPGPCSGTNVQVPNLVGLSVDQGRSTWTANGFSGSFTPATGFGTEIITGQTTVPASSAGDCVDPATTITVTHEVPPPPECTMPQLLGLKSNAGQSAFTTAGFTGPYTVTRPPNGNYDITSQSLVGGQKYACTSGVTVAGN